VFFIANGRVREILPNGVLITVAGGPNSFPLGDGGPAVLASLDPSAIALDSAGNLFVADHQGVRKVDTNGIINTVVSQAKKASGLAVDAAGSLYITDEVFADVYKLDSSGNLTTIVRSFDVQTATGGGLYHPTDLEFDGAGNLFIKDEARVVKRTPSGTISTVAGMTPDDGISSQLLGTGIGVYENGDLLVAEPTRHRVRRVRQLAVSGAKITGISPFQGAQGTSIGAVIKGVNVGATAVTFSGTGVTATVLPGSTSAKLPIHIDIAPGATLGTRTFNLTNGAITSPAYNGFTITGTGGRPVVSQVTPAEGTAGTTFTATITGLNLSGATAVTFDGTGVTATILSGGTSTSLPVSIAMAPDAVGGPRTFAVTTSVGTSTPALFTVKRMKLTGILPSLGSTGTSMTATLTGTYLSGANAVTFSGTGVTATVNPGGTDSSIPITITIASGASLGVHTVSLSSSLESSTPFNGLTVIQAGSDGIITTVAGNGLTNFGGDGQLAINAGLDNASSIAVDAAGNLFIADRNHHRVRKVTPGGIITTVAGNGEIGSAGLGGPATEASFAGLQGITVDAAGNLFIADGSNNRILKVDVGGTITRFAGNGQFGFDGDGGQATAARLNSPTQVQVDKWGTVYIADTNNGRIRKVSTDGVIRTVAGGGHLAGPDADGKLATLASLPDLSDIAVDTEGNLFLTNSRWVQKLTPDGKITTIAGSAPQGFGGDGGPSAAAGIFGPRGITVDPAGNLLFVDVSNRRIRRVNPAGIITTVAGSGIEGFSGDGGSATAARIGYPMDVATDKDGNLYIADPETARIRKVTYSLPVITTVSPLSSATGTSITAAIRGLALHNATAATFAGSGVTATILPGGTSTNVPVSVTIGASAEMGQRPLSITTTHGTSPLFDGFEVVPTLRRSRGQITSQ
jgi:sugar lactone lactonase YvrE